MLSFLISLMIDKKFIKNDTFILSLEAKKLGLNHTFGQNIVFKTLKKVANNGLMNFI